MEFTHIEKLGDEWASSDSCSVGLHNTNNVADVTRRDAETSANTPYARIARCDERVGSKVEVKHEGVGSLDEDPLVVK